MTLTHRIAVMEAEVSVAVMGGHYFAMARRYNVWGGRKIKFLQEYDVNLKYFKQLPLAGSL
jgi:hypothetical protein